MEKLAEYYGPGRRRATTSERKKPDGTLTFDRLTDVYHSGTKHDEDQPAHLHVADTNVCETRCREEYGNPARSSARRRSTRWSRRATIRRRPAPADQLLELRPLQDLRRHGSLPDHHLGHPRGRRRAAVRRPLAGRRASRAPDCASPSTTIPLFREHDSGPGHPERPERLDALRRGLREAGLEGTLRLLRAAARPPRPSCSASTPRSTSRASPRPGAATVRFDPDTQAGPRSYEAALLAAGAVVDAVDRVLDGEIDRAFCAVRPPGHHADRGPGHGLLPLQQRGGGGRPRAAPRPRAGG